MLTSLLFVFVCIRSIDLGYTTSTSSCSGSKEKSVVCYFTSWAFYRKGLAKFTPENINASLCTHINYAFASLDKTSHKIVPLDSEADINKKLYESVTAFKKYGLKVLISIGGWTNSEGNRWIPLIRSPSARAVFVSSVVTYLKKYNFDGLDVDYEYPGCPKAKRTANSPTDSKNFNSLLSELKNAFGKKYLLTVATAADKSTIKACYHMTELCQLVDWVNVMTYDYHSFSDGVTGANAPLGSGSSAGVTKAVMHYLGELRCPANKIVLGIPFYGKTFTMVNPSRPLFGAPASGPGTPGSYTNNAGTLAYYEICLLIKKSGYSTGLDEVNDSYAWKGSQFISYDGPSDIVKKASFIKAKNLRGAMVWALEHDDFSNMCGCGRYPLLTTLNQQLRCLKSSKVQCY